MDPLSALGAAAASAQFVGYAVKGLLGARKIWKHVKGAPVEIQDLLRQIEREISSINRLIDTKSPLAYQYLNGQRAHIVPFATEAAGAIKRLEDILRPFATDLEALKGQKGVSKQLARSWKKIMTVKTLSDIKENLEVIERLNASLTRELQISMIPSQSQLLDQSSQILTETTSVSARLDSTSRSIQDLQTSHFRTETTLYALGDSISSVSKSMVLAQEDASKSLVSANNKLTNMHDDLSSKLQANNEILMQFFGRPIDERDKPMLNLRDMIRTEMAIELSQPQDTVKGRRVNTLSHSGLGSFYGPLSCACKRGRQPRIGHIILPNQNGRTYQCPLHGPVRSWNYQLKANLSPFMSGALELSLNFLSKRQGFSLSPSLKFHVVVKRCESNLFFWFDAVEKVLGRRASMIRKENATSDAGSQLLPFRSLKTIVTAMSYLVEGVHRSIARGLASGSDTDENGRTLLFEIFWLLVLLGPERIHFTKEIISLLQLVRASEVNIAATTHMGNWLSLETDTATIQVSATFLFHKFRLYDLDPVIYKEFANFDTLLDDVHAPTRIHTGPSFLKLLIANPEVAEAAGYPELSMAIIRRSLPDTMRLARTADKTGPSGRDHWLWAPELALGWPEGLQFLAGQGFNVLRGLRMAAISDDYESASILLTTEAPIFSNCDLNTSALYDDLICELAMIDNKVHLQMYAQELWRRGAEMRNLASGYLSPAEVNELNLREDSAWFGRLEVLRLLSQKAEFPHKLMDALAILPHYVIAHEMGDESLSVHEMLYKIGWTDVDAGYEYGHTPLIELCRHFVSEKYHQDIQKWLGMILWFIRKGANPRFLVSDIQQLFWPHLQFYLAAAYPTVRSDKSAVTRSLCSEIIESCNHPAVSDGCECYCSSRGCIPPFLLWRCHALGNRMNHAHCQKRDRLKWIGLQDWMAAWKVTEIERQRYYREICRLEMFERLGAQHTCCAKYERHERISWRTYYFAGEEVDENRDFTEEMRHNQEEIAEIRAEDRPLAEQIQLIMRWYERLRKVLDFMSHKSFWKTWWSMADHILLTLRAEEACHHPRWTVDFICSAEFRVWPYPSPRSMRQVEKNKETFVRDREDRWADHLEGAGYGGWDFRDVINHHFAMFWTRAKAYRHRVRSWKRHRLVSKPKLMVTKKNKSHRSTKANMKPGYEWLDD